MSDASRPVVARRAVFLVGGYERNDAAGFFRRIGREMGRFQTCWSVRAEMGEATHAPDQTSATATVRYAGPDGDCVSNITFLSYDDIVRRDGARPMVVRLWVYLLAFFDYVFSGTMVRFFATNWRFALYFLYPFTALCGFVFVGYTVFRIANALGVPGGPVLPLVLGLLAMVLVARYLGRRYFVFHLMDLWSFSREHLHCRRPEMDQRLDAWATMIDERLSGGPFDEVLLVGHSTGGALILDLADLLQARLDGRGADVNFTLLTVGSTSMKVGLHPAAQRARGRLKALSERPAIRWIEFQALTDIINFYKCDPFTSVGLVHNRPDSFPEQYQVRFRQMLEPAAYKRIRRNFFRVHYQFISANSRRYFYDFFMICFGTRRLEAATSGSLPIAAMPDDSSTKGSP